MTWHSEAAIKLVGLYVEKRIEQKETPSAWLRAGKRTKRNEEGEFPIPARRELLSTTDRRDRAERKDKNNRRFTQMDTNGKGNSYFPGNLACLGKAERRRVANLACLGKAQRRRVDHNTLNTSRLCSKRCS